MPRSLPPLNALRAFEAAARLSSFTRAARELHVTPAAVSHQIRGLEKYLGITLFKRTGQGLELTGQGRQAAEHFRDGFERIARGVRQLCADQSGATINVSVTSAFATRWLVPRLGRFLRRFPGIDLRVMAGAQPVDFDHDDVDVAVRIGRGGIAGAVAVPLFAECIAPLANTALIRQIGLRSAADLGKATLLHDDSMRRVGRTTGWPEWLGAARVRTVDAGRGLFFDDGHLVLQAAAAGRGVALGRLVYALDDLASRRLRMPFGPILELDLQYFLYVPEARVDEPAIASFRQWFIQEAALFAPQLRAVVIGGLASPSRPTSRRRRARQTG
jgi:LysR family glycine cleavage system transcriptional activator